MRLLKFSLMTIMIAAMLLLTGCDSDSNSNASQAVGSSSNTSSTTATADKPVENKSSAETSKKEPVSLDVKVYYPDNQGLKLLAVKRTVKLEGTDKYKAAITSLMSGTKDSNQTNIIPKQTKLNSITVKDGIAYVDFNDALVKKFTGGSTGEEMLVGSIVNTLTEFSEIKKVQILVNGKKIESIAGHIDLTTPQPRMENLLK